MFSLLPPPLKLRRGSPQRIARRRQFVFIFRFGALFAVLCSMFGLPRRTANAEPPNAEPNTEREHELPPSRDALRRASPKL